MSIAELILIGIGLSADAFAVAVCKGLNMRKVNAKIAVIIGFFFGGFQALMPFIGWLLGKQFEKYIVSIDHWIAFLLLAFIGGKMIYEVVCEKKDDDEKCKNVREIPDLKELFLLAVATSIDALAVGITFAFLKVDILTSASLIGAITFILSFSGVYIGGKFGAKYKSKAELAGGLILVLIGVKILFEHLGIINF